MRIPIFTFISGITLACAANAQIIEAKLELKQTGESARKHNPECRTSDHFSAADVAIRLGAVALIRSVGLPLTPPILDAATPGNIDWLKGRMGVHDGRSTCATQCIHVPARPQYNVQACFSETGGDKMGCTSSVAENVGPPDWVAVSKFDSAPTELGTLYCATGKNWSHNRDRWFYLRATPVSR
jgi:hypothetical protein